MDPADADIPPPTRRPSRRRTASVRAARVLVRQLDWLDRPLVWWGGTPAAEAGPPAAGKRAPKKPRTGATTPATPGASPPDRPPADPAAGLAPDGLTAFDVITSRLRGRPRGAYAVTCAPAPPDLPAAPGLEYFLASTAPTLADLVPVDEALVARSLRRLMRVPRQFPHVLPTVVGDVAAWHGAAESALKRVRPLIPPRKPTPAELLAIECAAVWLDADDPRPSRSLDVPTLLTLAHDVGAPEFSRAAALVLGQRRLNSDLPSELRPWHRCGRAFPAWPPDVLALAAEAAGPAELCAAAARDPGLADPSAAGFVREALLVYGAEGARRAVANRAALASLIDRLCDEPRARLGRLAAAQRDALEKAVALSGVHGPVATPPGGGTPERWAAVQLFRYAYGDAVATLTSGRPDSPKPKYRRALPRPAGGRPSPLQDLLAASRLWEHVLGDAPPDPVALSSRIYWLLNHRATTFESLPAQAAQILWDGGEPALRRLSTRLRERLWTLATRLTLGFATGDRIPSDVPPLPARRERAAARALRPQSAIRNPQSAMAKPLPRRTGRGGLEWHAAAAAWVEACCAACRPGITADAHADAAFLGLFGLGDSPESSATLAALAPVLTETWPTMKGSADAWYGARGLLLHRVTFARAAAAAGLDAGTIREILRRDWIDEITSVLSRSPQRLPAALRWLRRLDLTSPPHVVKLAFVLLDGEMIDGMVTLAASAGDLAAILLQWALEFLTASAAPRDLEDGKAEKAVAARLAFARAAPSVLASLPQFLPARPGDDDARLWDWSRAAGVARAWFELGYPDPAAAFAATSAEDPPPADGRHEVRLLGDSGSTNLRNVVALTLGRLDRLAALDRVRRPDVDYQELAQMAAAWQWLEPLADWRDLLSRLACDPRTSGRATRVLARLGLCVRLQRGAEARARLEPLLEVRDLPPDVAAALESLSRLPLGGRGSCRAEPGCPREEGSAGASPSHDAAQPPGRASLPASRGSAAPPALGSAGASPSHEDDDLLRDLQRLCALRGGALPRAIREAACRPASLASELAALRASLTTPPPAASPSPAPGDRRRRRVENLERYLDDPAALHDWIESDLRKLLPPAIETAALESAEAVAEGIIRAHAIAVVGSPPPQGGDARNWDNALRLYFTVERNRGTLRRLLRGEARGDRSWIADHPENRRFLATVARSGIDVGAWTGPFEQRFATPGGEWTVSLETDPLHVLQMGNYFETCLSLDGANAFATVANAVEADKRVAYVRDARGVVIGRKLLLLTPRGRIVGFGSYGAGHFDRWEGRAGDADPTQPGPGQWVKLLLDVFSRNLADRCRARLDPEGTHHAAAKNPPSEIQEGLFCHWYNDGPEPFDPPWIRYSPERLRRNVIRGGRARKELEDLLQGEANERSAARRVLMWLGDDAAGVAR